MPSEILIRFANNPSDSEFIDLKPTHNSNQGLRLDFVAANPGSVEVEIGGVVQETRGNYFVKFIDNYNGDSFFIVGYVGGNDLIVRAPVEGFFVIGDVVQTSNPEVEVISVTDTPDTDQVAGDITGQAVVTGNLTNANAGVQADTIIGQAVLTGTLVNVGDGKFQMKGSVIGEAIVSGTLTGLFPYDKSCFNIVKYKKIKYNIVNYQCLDKVNKTHNNHGGL